VQLRNESNEKDKVHTVSTAADKALILITSLVPKLYLGTASLSSKLSFAEPSLRYSTAPYRRFRFPKSSTASKRSFLVKSGQSLGVTYISV
jgi:hypothetical protein